MRFILTRRIRDVRRSLPRRILQTLRPLHSLQMEIRIQDGRLSIKSDGVDWTDYDPTLGASDEILTNLCDALLHTAQVMQELYED